MSDLSTFGQRIKQLRQENNLSQRDFAERIGVTASALSSYEKAQKNPSVNVAVKIATEFKVSLDWLCGLTGGSNRFQPDDTIPFDLPQALTLLLELISYGILTIPKEIDEENDEIIGYDYSRLEVSGLLEDFLRDESAILNLYANGAISMDNLRICMDEMTYRAAENIRKVQKADVAKFLSETNSNSDDTGNPFNSSAK